MDSLKEFQNQRELLDSYLKESENSRKSNEIRRNHILNSFNSDTINEVIKFSDLKLLKVGERIEMNENISFEKTYQDNNKMVFLTYMLEGGYFGFHEHDCFEFCKILKGNLFEKTRGHQSFSTGDIIAYAPFEIHKPYATSDSTYEVTFYKNLVNE